MITVFYILLLVFTHLDFSLWWLVVALIGDGIATWRINTVTRTAENSNVQLIGLSKLINDTSWRARLFVTEQYVLYREDVEFETDKDMFEKRKKEYLRNISIIPKAARRMLGVEDMPNELAERFNDFHSND